MGIITSLLVLSFLIFFHELGHFLVARFFGVRVEVFSIGFGKKIFSYTKGDTEYALSVVPLGGYVKMKGQDDTDPLARSEDNDSYNSKKPWQRIMILLAGPFANLLLAFLLYVGVGVMGVNKLAPVIGEVTQNSPAFQSGVKKDDKILAIDGKNIVTWGDLSNSIKESKNSYLIFKIARESKVLNIKITPKIGESQNIFREKIQKRMVGIRPKGEIIVLTFSLFDSFGYAYHETLRATTLIVKSVEKLISGAVPASELGGVISIVDYTSKASSMGIVALFMFTALLSVNLGVLNLLPIPALDGGHIVFNFYEMITNRPPSENMMYRLTIIGWVLLLGLMFLGVYNDLNRIFG